jgi:hypothetical protein
MLKRAYAVGLTIIAVACGGGSPNSPSSSTPSPATPATFSLTGLVTDITTGAGLSGATVSVADGPNAGKSALTDSSGNYTLAGLQQSSFTLNASASNYVSQSKAVTLASSQTLSFQLGRSTPPAGGFSGVRYDNIQMSHQFIFGSPIPTQNQTATYCCWPLSVRNAGNYILNLASFPLNTLPSGGSSNVISDSEMVLVGLNVSPAAGTMSFQWHKAVNQDTVVYTYTTPASFVWSYAFIGHFSWEISEPGGYYVIVDTPWGSARIDFQVTNSTLTQLRFRNDTVLASHRLLDANTRSMVEGGGGGGGGREIGRSVAR